MGQATLVHEGNIIDHTPAGAVAAGDVIVQDVTIGIAVRPIAATKLGSLQLGGVYDVVHVADIVAAGAAVYWDADGDPYGGEAGTGCATVTVSDNVFMGWAVAAATATDGLVRVKLFGSPAVTANYYGPLSLAIADPGDGEAIVVTTGGYVPLVSAGAGETRTLAAPAFIGQQMVIYMKTDGGGDVVITVATTVNETGNNTITFANPGEACHLIAVEEDATLRWRFAHVDGAALSTA